MRKLSNNYTYLEILVTYIYLNNPFEETILFRSNEIKEQHEIMKLQNEEVILKST